MVERARRARRSNETAVVNPTRGSKAIICLVFIVALPTSRLMSAQSASRSAPEPEWSAVDAEGVRHRPSDYGDKRAPWLADRVKFVQPNYPTEARARHIHGTGCSKCVRPQNWVCNSCLAPKEREEREKRLALFQERKAFRDEF